MNLLKKIGKLILDKKDNKVEDAVDFGNDFVKKSYSQCGEDLIINYLFSLRGLDMPSYIDIGANHPWFINNTAFFYKKGCRGLNIEPNSELVMLFKQERPLDKSINMGISNSASLEMDFYVFRDNTLSTFSKEEADNFVRHGKEIEKVAKIKTSNIQKIIKEYNSGIFPDFLNIDVEGFELEILQGISYEDNYPKVICVETAEYSPTGAGEKREGLMDFIESKGYYLYADTNLNSIYIKNEFWLRV